MLYKLGKHKLICGDCRESKVISQLLQNEKVNLCVTSPPYNIGFNAGIEKRIHINSNFQFKYGFGASTYLGFVKNDWERNDKKC